MSTTEYRFRAVQTDTLDRYPIARALLELWNRPASPTALRFARHALQRAYVRGIDVLEF